MARTYAVIDDDSGHVILMKAQNESDALAEAQAIAAAKVWKQYEIRYAEEGEALTNRLGPWSQRT